MDPVSFGSLDPDPEVYNERKSSTKTAEKRPEEQTRGGHHLRNSPDESYLKCLDSDLKIKKCFFLLLKDV